MDIVERPDLFNPKYKGLFLFYCGLIPIFSNTLKGLFSIGKLK